MSRRSEPTAIATGSRSGTMRCRPSFVWTVLPPVAVSVYLPLLVLSDASLLLLAESVAIGLFLCWTAWAAWRQTVSITDERIDVATSSRYLDRLSSPVSLPLAGVQVHRRLVIRRLFGDVVRWTLSQEGVRGEVTVNVFWLRRAQRRELSDLLLAVAAEDNGRPAEGRTLVKTSCGPAPRPKNYWGK